MNTNQDEKNQSISGQSGNVERSNAENNADIKNVYDVIVCNECRGALTTYINWKEHTKVKHTHLNPFKCRACPHEEKVEEKLVEHIKEKHSELYHMFVHFVIAH